MKRFLALFLALLMLVSLAACSSQSPDKPTDKPAPDDTDKPAQTDAPAPETDAPASGDFTFTEMTVVDNENCSIVITGLEDDSIWGFTMKVALENKSADKNYMFTITDAAVNGVKCSALFASEVSAGKKANETASFSDSVLEENGIGTYTDIEVTFRVYDSDDWSADDVALETVRVFPYGEDKATRFVREVKDTDTVLVDTDDVTVVFIGAEFDDIWGYKANLFMVNKTDTSVMFSADDVSVNGFMADPYFATTVPAGKCAFGSMTWSDSSFEENGITDVESIEFLLKAYDYDDWMADHFVEQTITLTP